MGFQFSSFWKIIVGYFVIMSVLRMYQTPSAKEVSPSLLRNVFRVDDEFVSLLALSKSTTGVERDGDEERRDSRAVARGRTQLQF